MTNLVRIRSPHASNVTPFCEARVNLNTVPQFYAEMRRSKQRRKGLPEDRCGQRASYLLEGRSLCHAHAGKRALEILVKQETTS